MTKSSQTPKDRFGIVMACPTVSYQAAYVTSSVLKRRVPVLGTDQSHTLFLFFSERHDFLVTLFRHCHQHLLQESNQVVMLEDVCIS